MVCMSSSLLQLSPSKMLTELNLADKTLHKLKSQGVDINDMKKKLKRHGDSALERLLEQMDVDKALLAIELRIMGNSCKQSLPTSFNTHQPPSLL
jgi:hypothetical protein